MWASNKTRPKVISYLSSFILFLQATLGCVYLDEAEIRHYIPVVWQDMTKVQMIYCKQFSHSDDADDFILGRRLGDHEPSGQLLRQPGDKIYVIEYTLGFQRSRLNRNILVFQLISNDKTSLFFKRTISKQELFNEQLSEHGIIISPTTSVHGTVEPTAEKTSGQSEAP